MRCVRCDWVASCSGTSRLRLARDDRKELVGILAAEEHRPAFRKHVKWRTGGEGRISSLKRGYGWDRTRIDGTAGAQIWTGQGVFAHNLVKIGALAS